MEANGVIFHIKREDLGPVTPRRHIFIDFGASFADRLLKDVENPSTE